MPKVFCKTPHTSHQQERVGYNARYEIKIAKGESSGPLINKLMQPIETAVVKGSLDQEAVYDEKHRGPTVMLKIQVWPLVEGFHAQSGENDTRNLTQPKTKISLGLA